MPVQLSSCASPPSSLPYPNHHHFCPPSYLPWCGGGLRQRVVEVEDGGHAVVPRVPLHDESAPFLPHTAPSVRAL